MALNSILEEVLHPRAAAGCEGHSVSKDGASRLVTEASQMITLSNDRCCLTIYGRDWELFSIWGSTTLSNAFQR